jgi:hypothetical protein
MTERDIKELESELGKPFPKGYKALLLNYPQELIDLELDEKILINDKDQLLALNEKWHQWIGALAIIAIGEDGDGGYYFINMSDETIYELDYENAQVRDKDGEEEDEIEFDFLGSIELVNDTLDEYIEFNKRVI